MRSWRKALPPSASPLDQDFSQRLETVRGHREHTVLRGLYTLLSPACIEHPSLWVTAQRGHEAEVGAAWGGQGCSGPSAMPITVLFGAPTLRGAGACLTPAVWRGQLLRGLAGAWNHAASAAWCSTRHRRRKGWGPLLLRGKGVRAAQERPWAHWLSVSGASSVARSVPQGTGPAGGRGGQ